MTSSPSPSPEDSPDAVVVAQTFKVLVLGDSGVGKSSLIHYYTQGSAPTSMLSTIGVDYRDMVITVRGVRVKLRVWDTAGQERFHTFTKQFFRGTQGILLVYDITSISSFTMLSKWLRMLTESGLDHVDKVLIGNKCDLVQKRTVPVELPQELSSRQCFPHIETSSFTGQHVRKAFYRLAELLVHSHNIFMPGIEAAAVMEGHDDTRNDGLVRSNGSGGDNQLSSSIILSNTNIEKAKKKKKSKCCQS